MSLIGFSPSFPNQASVNKAHLMIPISRWFPDSPLKLPFSLVLALKQAFFFFLGGGMYMYFGLIAQSVGPLLFGKLIFYYML